MSFLAVALVLSISALGEITPLAPGPGDSFIAGSDCTIKWDPDTSGSWTNVTIDLMSGSNDNMTRVTNAASAIDGTNASLSPFSWTCPQVDPYSAIYFYQFTNDDDRLNVKWTTRFTITSPSGSSVPPENLQQPNGDAVPWGNGVLSAQAGTPKTQLSSSPGNTAYSSDHGQFLNTQSQATQPSTSSIITSDRDVISTTTQDGTAPLSVASGESEYSGGDQRPWSGRKQTVPQATRPMDTMQTLYTAKRPHHKSTESVDAQDIQSTSQVDPTSSRLREVQASRMASRSLADGTLSTGALDPTVGLPSKHAKAIHTVSSTDGSSKPYFTTLPGMNGMNGMELANKGVTRFHTSAAILCLYPLLIVLVLSCI